MSNEADQEKLLARWLSGELSEEERQLLSKEKGLDDLRFALDDLKGWKVPELDVKAGLDDLHTRIDQQATPKQSKQVFFQPWVRIAASVILIGAIYFLFTTLLTSGPTVITAGYGETISHVLPDGSRVDLNANSSISYSAKKWEDARELDLEGQALFTVQKGESFRVATNEGAVTVLGTIFDVKQREEGKLAVNVFEGLVRVDIANQQEMLKAGEGLTSKAGQVTRVSVSGDTPNWLGQSANFDNVPFAEVVTIIEDYYGIAIQVPAAKANDPFKGELNYGSLETALDILTTVFEVSYTRTGDTVVFE